MAAIFCSYKSLNKIRDDWFCCSCTLEFHRISKYTWFAFFSWNMLGLASLLVALQFQLVEYTMRLWIILYWLNLNMVFLCVFFLFTVGWWFKLARDYSSMHCGNCVDPDQRVDLWTGNQNDQAIWNIQRWLWTMWMVSATDRIAKTVRDVHIGHSASDQNV